MSLGSRIASMRGFHRYTQAQLGGLIGVTKQTVSGWETDRRLPDANDLRKLCQIFGCTADYLLELRICPSNTAPHLAKRGIWDALGTQKSRPHAWGRLAARPKPKAARIVAPRL